MNKNIKNKYIDIEFFARKDSMTFFILPMFYVGVCDANNEFAVTFFLFKFKIGISIIVF